MSEELSAEARTLKLGIYKHFKGPLYEVFFVARHSETHEEFVVYRPVDKESMWVRPLAMFLEKVERDDYSGPRFVYVGEQL